MVSEEDKIKYRKAIAEFRRKRQISTRQLVLE